MLPNQSDFRCAPRRRRSNQAGTSLIEMLIVMVIFAVGILGVAALQIVGNRGNSAAIQRTSATILAYDIFEAMRSNRTAASNGEYNFTSGSSIPTGSTVAQQDLNKWLTEIAARLPSGTASISNPAFNLGDAGIVTVTVTWDERRNKQTSSASTTNFAVSGRL